MWMLEAGVRNKPKIRLSWCLLADTMGWGGVRLQWFCPCQSVRKKTHDSFLTPHGWHLEAL